MAKHKWDMFKFLTNYGQELIANFVNPDNNLVNIIHKVDDPIISPIRLLRNPFEKQAEHIEGLVKHLFYTQGRATALVNGQMGVGKSLIGSIVAGKLNYLSRKKNYTALIAAPPQLGPKWAREVELTLPGAHCWLWDSDLRSIGFPFALAGAKAPTSRNRYVVRDLLGDIFLLSFINRESNEYELTPLNNEEFVGLNFYFLPYSVLRMHYHTKDWFPEGCAKRPELNRKLNLELVKQDECKNKEDDVIARCPRCGNPFKVEKQNGTWRYMTVGELERKRETVICKAPRFPKKTLTVVDSDGNTVKRNVGEWWSTPSEKGKTRICGEVFRVNVRQRAVDEPEPEVPEEEAEVVVDESGEEVQLTPHKLARVCSPAYRYKKKLKKQRRIDFVLPDEVHALKNDGPQGKTGRWLMTAAQKVLCLTGTLTGGYATDLFYLLWAIAPKELRALGYTYRDVGKFENMYGAKEVKISTTTTKGKGGEKKEKTERKPRKMPGISGRIYSDFLVNKSTFLMMADLHQVLPPYTEELVLVPMSEEMEKAYVPLVNNFRAEMAKVAHRDFASLSGLVSAAMHVWCSWLDRLRADKISGVAKRPKHSKKGVDIRIEVEAPEIDVKVTPKEQWIIDKVKDAKARGRKTIIYMVYTDKRDCAARLQSVLVEAGLRAKVMYANVAAKKREKWIRDNTPDLDCLICNPELVKEGLDLYDYPTLISAQPICNLYTHRQAMARSWRLGQDKEVEAFYVGYKDTVQERLMALIASKLDSALLAEGNATDSALFEISYSPDSILREMVQAIIAGSDELLKLTTLGRKTNQEILMAASAEEFAAKGFAINEAPDPGTPVTTTEITTVSEDGSVRVIYVQTYQRRGGKKVRHSLAMTPDELEQGVEYQLCLFDLSEAA